MKKSRPSSIYFTQSLMDSVCYGIGVEKDTKVCIQVLPGIFHTRLSNDAFFSNQLIKEEGVHPCFILEETTNGVDAQRFTKQRGLILPCL